MTNSPYIVVTTPTRFNSLVLENSERGPVMFYYWSPRAGPCMKLMPRLIRLADEYTGAMEQLLEIVRRDRTSRDDAGRKGLIAIFNMLGHEDQAASSYRALLTEALN
jgi:putative thioredoxin